MKTSVRLFFTLFAFAVLLLSLSACKKEENPTITSTYVYTPQGNTTENTTVNTAENKENLLINTAWQSSYNVTYKYYNNTDEKGEVSVTEKRGPNAFSVEYLNQGDILYYVANGSNIDYYVLVPDETEQMHSVIENKSLKDLSSTFMKLTSVSANLPGLANVIYVGEESIAGRTAQKYIQRAYQNGVATETVYLWIDKEFGFASKCESYNQSNHITTSWEIVNFTSGDVKDTDVEIDLSKYTFQEN